jgi:hypothetical protein
MYKTTGFRAVWSILLTYIIETGVVGLVAISFVGSELMRAWRRCRDRTVFLLVLVVWLAGITVTTSYVPLLALWVTLAWLSVWPEVADAR